MYISWKIKQDCGISKTEDETEVMEFTQKKKTYQLTNLRKKIIN